VKLPDPISSLTWDQLTADCVIITRGSKVVYHFKIVLNNLGFHVNNSHNRHMTCQNYNTCYSRRGSTPFGSRNSAWMCLISALGTGGVKFLGFGFYWKRTFLGGYQLWKVLFLYTLFTRFLGITVSNWGGWYQMVTMVCRWDSAFWINFHIIWYYLNDGVI